MNAGLTGGMTGRIIWIDIARTVALIGMAIYHFSYDLAMFGLVPAAFVISGPLKVFAIVIASSFLALAGLSLQIAHGAGIRWPAFWRRFAIIAAAATAITLLTWVWVGDAFIFYGILHSIAVSSLAGLAFLSAPIWATALVALAVLAVPQVWGHPLFDTTFLTWTGLGLTQPATLDYEPFFPWFAAFLAGMILAKLMRGSALMCRRTAGPVARALAWPGQHSLLIYLAHQPVLIGILWLTLRLF